MGYDNLRVVQLKHWATKLGVSISIFDQVYFSEINFKKKVMEDKLFFCGQGVDVLRILTQCIFVNIIPNKSTWNSALISSKLYTMTFIVNVGLNKNLLIFRILS